MKILPEPLSFEWDKGNLGKNLKHKVSDKEAEEAFINGQLFIFKDQKHSQIENRYGFFGRTGTGRLLSIVFTIRRDKIRIITARDTSKKERKSYEKEIKKHS